MPKKHLKELKKENALLQKALKQVVECLENWMEIADDEDVREYDRKAVVFAMKVLRTTIQNGVIKP